MSETNDCIEQLPLKVIYTYAKYGRNVRRYFKKNNIDPDMFMEMITCNTIKS